MTISIIIALFIGMISGYNFIPVEFTQYTEISITVLLSLLLFFVGIDIGQNKKVFKDIKKHGVLILIIPISIIIGSALGGIFSSIIFGMKLNEGMAISAGYGWYSLSGIMLTKLHGAELGTIGFLTNVIRELIAILSIPFIAKYLNYYTAIAPAGATSMDTTLPIISNYTSEETVVIAFVNGVILSSLVPILVPFFYSL